MRRIALAAATIAFVACSEESPGPDIDPTITLSADSVMVPIGGTTTVTATVKNFTGLPQFVSRDTAIATVNATGTITGVRNGRTVVVGTLVGAGARDSVIVAVGTPVAAQLPLLGTGTVTERYTAEVAVAEPYAYTTTWGAHFPGPVRGDAVKIWNVTGNTPILVDSLILSGAGTVSDVQISSDGALLAVSLENGGAANNGIAMFNRSNPAKPTLIRRYTSFELASGVHTLKLGRINNRHYAFLSVNPGISFAKLVVVDITDPANPVEVAVREMGDPFIHDVFIRDGILFAALWDTGLTMFDVGGANRGGSPANPVEMGTVVTKNCSVCGVGTASVHNVWWYHDPNGNKRYAFIGEEGPANTGGGSRASGAVHVVDVSNDFNTPVEIAAYEPDSTTTWSGRAAGAHNFVVDEPSGVLYAAFYNGGVRALDIRGDLSACTAAQKTADGRCDLLKMGREIGVALSNTGVMRFIWGVAMQGNNLYASDMHNGIHKINIASLKR